MKVLLKRIYSKGFLPLLLLVVTAAPAAAQRPIAMTTHQAAEKARAVVNARVLGVDVRDVGGNIFTFVDFQVLSVAKGDVSQRFTYRMLGGRLGNVEIASNEEMPKFAVGDEVVLFFGREVSDGYPTILVSQVYRIVNRGGIKYVTPSPTGFAASDLRGGPVNASSPTRLDDLLNAIRTLK